MRKPFALLVLIVLVMVAAGMSFARRAHLPSTMAPSGNQIPVSPSLSTSATPSPSMLTAPAASPRALSAQLKNQKFLASLLHEFIKPERKPEELFQFLRSSRQRPYLLRDKNDITGEMDIIRTKSPLPGTRYFHAQYFGDANNPRFLQHMSFELPGSEPQAWSQALDTVQSSFPGLRSPVASRPDFVEWDAGDGYSLWIKRLDASDLKDNPFNAYTPADVGTIRVAIELNPEAE